MDQYQMKQKPYSRKSVIAHIIDFLLKEGLTLITGATLGATIALALSYEDATAFWGMVGSMLGGLGTVGLLAFGWVKANEWLRQAHEKKLLDIKLQSIENINTAISKWQYSILSIDSTTLLNQLHKDFSDAFVIVNREIKFLSSISWRNESITNIIDNLNENFENLKLDWLADFHILTTKEAEFNVEAHLNHKQRRLDKILLCNGIYDQSKALQNAILGQYQ